MDKELRKQWIALTKGLPEIGKVIGRAIDGDTPIGGVIGVRAKSFDELVKYFEDYERRKIKAHKYSVVDECRNRARHQPKTKIKL
ncbi:MAG: hypothetical protein KatS3mg087_1899 [Patescibacteria group bacterium]|nr:MAG: hypothetical protein KatS3mg087_1899 [Patescibacteria group bacterium]